MDPIPIGTEKQLFLDSMFFDAVNGLELVVHSPSDGGVALQAEKPWENGETACTWCTVLRDPASRQYRMYYLGSATLGFKPSGKTKFLNSVCCAVSDDGVDWHKPEFGAVEFMGSRANNIVFSRYLEDGQELEVRELGTVVMDESDVPERRYKMMFFPKGCQMRLAYSADGIHWEVANDGHPVVRQFADSQNIFFWDDAIGRWVGYFRVHAGGRRIGRLETDNPECWPDLSPECIVLGPDELDSYVNKPDGPYLRSGEWIDRFGDGLRFDPDAPGGRTVSHTDAVEALDGVDFYNQPVIKYPCAARAYLMPFSAFYHRPNLLEVHLAVSRDGVHWDRPGDRQPWIRLPLDTEGVHMNYVGDGVIREGECLYHYHSHMRKWHARAKPGQYGSCPIEEYCGSIHRDVLRLDGYMSVNAGNRGGEFVTPPLVHNGRRLELNVDTGAGGWVKVELLDVRNRPTWDCRLADHALDDCERIVTNSTHHIVNWKSGSNVSKSAGRPMRMRVSMRNARLYAFQFVS